MDWIWVRFASTFEHFVGSYSTATTPEQLRTEILSLSFGLFSVALPYLGKFLKLNINPSWRYLCKGLPNIPVNDSSTASLPGWFEKKKIEKSGLSNMKDTLYFPHGAGKKLSLFLIFINGNSHPMGVGFFKFVTMVNYIGCRSIKGGACSAGSECQLPSGPQKE